MKEVKLTWKYFIPFYGLFKIWKETNYDPVSYEFNNPTWMIALFSIWQYIYLIGISVFISSLIIYGNI